jgi:hypothetical protein
MRQVEAALLACLVFFLAACPVLIDAAAAAAACKYDFSVYVYPLPNTLPAVQLAEEARDKNQLHVCQKCIFVSTLSVSVFLEKKRGGTFI